MLLVSFQKAVAGGGKTSRGKEVAEHGHTIPTGLPPPEEVPSEMEKLEDGERELEKLEAEICARKQKSAGCGTEDASDLDTADQMAYLVAARANARKFRTRITSDPFEWKKLPVPHMSHTYTTTSIPDRKVRHYVRCRTPLSPTASPGMHAAALAYFSDSWFIGTVTRVNPKARARDLGMMVSLDHSLWWHDSGGLKVDEGWLLVEMDSPWMGEERGVVTQRVWRVADGRLVGTCVQEGVVRLRDGRVEGVGEEENGKGGSKL